MVLCVLVYFYNGNHSFCSHIGIFVFKIHVCVCVLVYFYNGNHSFCSHIYISFYIQWCRGVDLSRWRELQTEKGELADMEKFVQHVHGNHFIPNTVIVDCTADSVIASHYYDWLRKGIHVVTPNKKANSGPLDQVIVLCMCEQTP